jgi:hypothetical protein
MIVLGCTKCPVDSAHCEALLKWQINIFPLVYTLFFFCSLASRTRWDLFLYQLTGKLIIRVLRELPRYIL